LVGVRNIVLIVFALPEFSHRLGQKAEMAANLDDWTILARERKRLHEREDHRTMKLALKHAVTAVLLVLSFVTPVVAGPLEDANAAIKRRDYATAVRLIRPLAEQGNANAQYNLGVFYDNGLGVPQDRVRAYMWLNLAAMQGRESAATVRDLTARLMTPAQIAEAQKLAREWKATK
jgi:TPR repeat protein